MIRKLSYLKALAFLKAVIKLAAMLGNLACFPFCRLIFPILLFQLSLSGIPFKDTNSLEPGQAEIMLKLFAKVIGRRHQQTDLLNILSLFFIHWFKHVFGCSKEPSH